MVLNEERPNDSKRKSVWDTTDLQWETINPAWGELEGMSEELKDKLTDIPHHDLKYVVNNDNEVIGIHKDQVWEMFRVFKRDLRLGNIDKERQSYCEYYLDLGMDFLHTDQVRPCLICLERVACKLELSQSVGGFLRKRLNTLTQESSHQELEPPKKSLFNIGKKQDMR